MGYEDRDLGLLTAEIQKASVNIERGDAATNARIDGIEKSVNELFRKAGRPGYNGGERDDGADFERKAPQMTSYIIQVRDSESMRRGRAVR